MSVRRVGSRRGGVIGRRAGGGWLVLIATAALGYQGCAPRPVVVPELAEAPRRARFEAAIVGRTSHLAAEAELNAWASGSKLPDLPGVQARLLLVGPDGFRMRVGSLFGIALDVSARGDSVTAYVPPRRMALTTESAGDSLGVADPGRLGYRLWSAAWVPPAAAWKSATWDDSLLMLRWMEQGDSVRLAVGSNGLPRSVAFDREGHGGARADYLGWSTWDGVLWPSALEVADATGDYGLRCHVQNVTFRRAPDRSRLMVAVPAGAARVTRDDLRRAIARLGKL